MPAPRPATRSDIALAVSAWVARIDTLAFRILGKLETGWRGGRARPVAPVYRDAVVVDAMAGRTAGPDVLARALSYSLREGAYESLASLVELLTVQLERLAPALRERALEDLVDALIALGDRPRAATLASRNPSLARSARGRTLLELLELSPSHPWLPNGRPNFMGLSRRIEAGSLDRAGLRSVIAGRPWAWLLYPELHLLAFGLAERAERGRGLSSLNRFLARHELPGMSLGKVSGGGDNILAELVALSAEPTVFDGPLVSVLVAARNAQATLGYALQSLLKQNYSPLEILVCDDASDDGTLELLQQLRRTDPRLRVFRSLRQQGAYNLRGALARHARGELLTFHDADDLAFSTRISKQVRHLQAGEASACVGSLLRITADGRIVFHKDQKATRLSLVTMMLKRSLFFELGGFRPVRFGGDWELYVKLRQSIGSAGLVRIEAPLMLGLCSSGSTTRSAGSEALEDGYRSPARRAYLEVVLAAQGLAPELSLAEQDARLQASGNHVEPSEIAELGLD